MSGKRKRATFVARKRGLANCPYWGMRHARTVMDRFFGIGEWFGA